MNKLSNRKPTVKEPFTSLHNVEYLFAVKSMVKGVSTDEETKGAPMARIELLIYALADKGHKKPVEIVFDSLALHSKTDWKVREFFQAIGALLYAKTITPNWQSLPGAKGRAVFCPETCEGKASMKVLRYMDPEEVRMRISA